MARRSTPQRKIDDAAFPVRVKVLVPTLGFGVRLNEMLAWLQQEFGARRFAHHAGRSSAGDAMALYFVDLEAAERFLQAFPDLELADGTTLPFYTRSGMVPGRTR